MNEIDEYPNEMLVSTKMKMRYGTESYSLSGLLATFVCNLCYHSLMSHWVNLFGEPGTPFECTCGCRCSSSDFNSR